MSCKIKTVQGIRTQEKQMERKEMILRYTSDRSGESLSIQSGNIVLLIDGKDIRAVMGIKQERSR